MLKGRDFLRAQLTHAATQHRTLLEDLEAHEAQADDVRYSDLCKRYIPHLREHQRMLEEYRASLGEPAGSVKEALGGLLGRAREAVDAVRGDDLQRLMTDIAEIRQAQDTFALFAAAGEHLGDARLAEIGQTGEADHDQMQRDFNELARTLFVQRVGGGAGVHEAAAD